MPFPLIAITSISFAPSCRRRRLQRWKTTNSRRLMTLPATTTTIIAAMTTTKVASLSSSVTSTTTAPKATLLVIMMRKTGYISRRVVCLMWRTSIKIIRSTNTSATTNITSPCVRKIWWWEKTISPTSKCRQSFSPTAPSRKSLGISLRYLCMNMKKW